MPDLLGLSLDVNTIGWELIDSETHQIRESEHEYSLLVVKILPPERENSPKKHLSAIKKPVDCVMNAPGKEKSKSLKF